MARPSHLFSAQSHAHELVEQAEALDFAVQGNDPDKEETLDLIRGMIDNLRATSAHLNGHFREEV